jgi:hypothetical protein
VITISDLSQLGNDVTCAQLRYSNNKEFVAIADTLEIMNDFKVRSCLVNATDRSLCRAMCLERHIVELFNVGMARRRSTPLPINGHGSVTDDVRRLRHFEMRCDKVLLLVLVVFLSFDIYSVTDLRFFCLNRVSLKKILFHENHNDWTLVSKQCHRLQRDESFDSMCIFLFRSIKI